VLCSSAETRVTRLVTAAIVSLGTRPVTLALAMGMVRTAFVRAPVAGL